MLDIVIVNYNTTDDLVHCLRSIYDSVREIPARVFVYDNASEEKVDHIASIFPQVILSKNPYNMGFARAINKAMKQTTAPYVALLNPDTIVLEDFFDSSLRYMQRNPDVGIIGPKILDADGTVQGSARSFPTAITGLFGRDTLLTKRFPNNPISRANILINRCDGKNPIEVDWVSGACMVLRRRAIDEVGLMDPRFFLYWEDADLCRRMWEKRWKVVYFPVPSVVHHGGTSSTKRPLRSMVEFHKSCYKLFEKYNKRLVRIISPFIAAVLGIRLGVAIAFNRIVALSMRPVSHRGTKALSDIPREDKRIKILLIITRFNIGGPSIHAHLVTKFLNQNKFHSILLSGKISPQEGDMSYLFDAVDTKPVSLPELQRELNLWMDLKALVNIFKSIREERPDIIHTHTAKAGFSGRLSALAYNLTGRRRVRIVHTFHGHVLDGYFSWAKSLMFLYIERLLAKGTGTIVALSETQKRELSEKYRIAPAAKIKTVELGFDLKPFLRCKSSRGRFRRDLGIESDTTLIGVVGRLVPIKNHKVFFQAARIFLNKNPGIPTKFIVVGDGEMRDTLEAYCRKQGLSRHVVFCGWIRDVPLVYADLDILALTSFNEGTPVSIIEAMASSVPVISTDAGGVMDLLGPPNGAVSTDKFVLCDRGILCQKDDALGLAKGLQYYVREEIREKQDRLDRARFFVEQRFTKERLLANLEGLYLDLMGKDSGEGFLTTNQCQGGQR